MSHRNGAEVSREFQFPAERLAQRSECIDVLSA